MSMAEDFIGKSATILLVDDESHVTDALRRVLHHQPYRVLTAQSGDQALELMEQHTIDLVLSDARMPGMDGATLLGKIYERWPSCIRILLTGYADINATIKAINDGQIYRYLSKPWNNDELCLTIEQSLAYKYAEQERVRLLKLTQDQNQALLDMNEHLERRVQERTIELFNTAQLLKKANNKLERGYVTATEVFSSLINQRLPKSRQTNQEVIALIRAFCVAHDVTEKDARDLEMAAALYNIGKLTWRDEMIALPLELLGKEQRQLYRDYPAIGEQLLMALEHAKDAALMIRHHQERWDGAGYPDGLQGDEIPWGARLIKMAVDTVEVQMGMIQKRQRTLEEVLQSMENYAGRLYDPLLCSAFIEVASTMAREEAEGDESVLAVQTGTLESGMITVKKLYSAAGTLLLGEGTVLTPRIIERLQEFERYENSSYMLHVQRPDVESHD